MNTKYQKTLFVQLWRISSISMILALLVSAVGVNPVSADSGCPCSIWPDSVTIGMVYDNPIPIEVGLKFRSDVAGFVTGVRFFKSTGTTGTHIGRLWSSNGTKLAEVTYMNETSAGWQSAMFSTPAAIQANTTYIISYYIADGNRRLSLSQNFFTSVGVDAPPLHALATGVDGSNGVFSENSVFFGQTYKDTNYWVDLIFDGTTDTIPPTVTSVSPTDGAVGVLASTNISAVFSEAMNASSINTSSFVLRDPNNKDVTASISYDQVSHTAVLDPNINLNFSTTYTAIVLSGDGGVTDFAGNPLTDNYTWSFTVEASDTTPPTVSSVSPANSANEFLISANVSAIFSEAMDQSTIAGNFELLDPYSIPVPATVNYDTGTNTVLLDPTANLNYGAAYTARIKGGAMGVKDVGGNSMATDYVWTFTTTTPPIVNSVSPIGGSGDVLISSNVSAVFSKDMDENTINSTTFELRNPSNNLVSASITYDSTSQTAVLNPTSNLAYATIYTAVIKGGTDGVKDVVGNSLASDYIWSFTSESMNATPPTVTSVKPINGVTKLRLETKATAYFSRAMDPNSFNSSNFELRNALGTLVPANITYNPSDNSAILSPVSTLDYSTTYTARIISGTGGPKDTNGIAMAADYSWSFGTIAQRPPVDQAPDGPILIITSPTNLFTRYYVEIIRTEGFNEFALMDIGAVTPEALDGYDIVVLGDMALTSGQVTTLSDWVTAGGHLIAMRPDKQLIGLLGLTDASSTLSNAYLQINTSTGPGAGIVGQTLQFHGTADQYTLSGATSLATLYSTATTATTYPAVTLRSVGANGGQAAAFTFDLARSIVYTHQGNPAWQTGHVNPYQGYGTAVDLFAGIGGEPNWIDFSKINIPQADEQQRFLANLIIELNADEMPLPRFWYFPSFKKAAIILTGDDHIGRGSPSGSSQIFFDRHIAQSPLGCSVQDWECVRSSSYGYVGNTISDATYAAYTAQGFEFGVHADAGLASGGGWCGTWPADMLSQFTAQYNALFDKFASLPVQSSERDHCYSWFGYTGPDGWIPYTATPEGNEAQGIRLDTNISYNPSGWATVNPGYQMGSGMLMRFAQVDASGVMHRYMDIYNGGTQMNDDNGQGAVAMRTIVDSYLDAAIGSLGYYGAFVVNMHSDNWYGWSYDGSDQIVASAQTRHIPVVSGAQMVEWLDGRNNSYFSNIFLTGDELSFDINQAVGARNLRAMLPTHFGGDPLTLLKRNGSPISMPLETIKGVEYVIFDAQSGSYSATYTPDTFPPAISSLAAEPAVGGTAEITWMTNETATTRVDYGTDPNNLSLGASTPGFVTQHTVQLGSLLPHTTYFYRVTSSDESSNAATYPVSGDAPASFITPSAAFIDTTVSDFTAGTPDANLAISQIDNGEVMLKPYVYEEFNGTALPAGWDDFFGMPGTTGSVTVSGGKLTVNRANAGTIALFGPGHAVEFTATFFASPNQHAGFGVNHTANPGDAWAIFSTGQSGTQLVARSYNGAAPWDTASTVISGNYLGSPHRYRVEWQANQIIYSIDGEVVATHDVAISIQMRPLVSEGGTGGASFSVDQLQMGPFPGSGQFTSRILDALGSVTDGTIAWDAVAPANTTMLLSVHTGNTPIPDGTWSAFSQVQNGDPIGSGFRYVQYQANFTTTDTAVTPLLQEVRIPYNTTLDEGAPQITARTPAPGANAYSDVDVSVTFNEPMQPGSITGSSFRLREVGSNVDVDADVSYSGLTATLHPLAPLTPTRQYQVTVAGTVTDLSGNPRGDDDIWTFTVIQLPGSPWMNTDWAYRRAVTITSSCAQIQTDYPVKIILDSTFDFSNAKPDGSDLRITLLDDVTAVPFWIESWSSGSAVVWAKLSSLPLEEVGLYLYYGNQAATSLSSSAGIFSFSDEFSGTSLDLTKWALRNGSPPTFDNGVMTLLSTTPYGRIDSVPSFGQGYMMEALMRHPQAGTSNLVSEVGFASASEFVNTLRIMDDFPDTANVTNWQWVTDASGLTQGKGIMSLTTLNTGWNHFRIGRIAGTASLQVNDWTSTTITTNLPTANMPAFLMSYGNNNQMQVNWLFVRKWCGSEPTSMVGDKESLNIPPVAVNDTYNMNAGTTLNIAAPGVLTNDTDADLDPLTAVKVSDPAHGILILNANGSFTYTPPSGFSGEVTFTYKANDGNADSNVATVTISVSAVTPPPPLPSSFYGEIHIFDNPPSSGDKVEIFAPGIIGPVATATISLYGSDLVYFVDVSGDIIGTLAKEGGAEGDLLTFKIGDRVVATGRWHSGTSVQLNLHPPQAIPGGPYSGNVGTAISFNGSANDWLLSDTATYQWDWDNDHIYDETGQNPSHAWPNFGNYTVGLKVTDSQGGVGTATATVDIGKASSTVTVTCPTTPQTYTGSAIEACTASYSTEDGLSGTLTPTYEDNVIVGTATASATYAGDANHEGSSGSKTFGITKAASTVTVSCPTTPQTYTGSAIEACTASYSGAGGLTGTLTPTYANNVDVGKATASATFAGDDNHTGSSGSATFDIGKAASTVTVSCPTTPQTYTGSAIEACTASYSGAGGLTGTLTPTYANNVDVGKATASATFAGDDNHTGSSGSATFDIGKAASTVTVSCPTTPQTYTGSAIEACTASYSGAGGLTGTLTPTYANNVDVGKATASATFAGDDNHTGSSGSATFDIGKAVSTVTVSCPTTPQTYTGSAIEACTASYSGAGGLTGTLTPTYANNVDVGKATASATFAGDDNHTGSSGSATFDIGKAVSTVTVSCPTTPQTYTGSAIEACTASYSGAGGLTGTLTPTYANNVDVGKATASATFAGDDNHTGSSGSATFDIGKAASTVTVSCPTTPQTYTGSAIEACTASYSGAGGLTGTLTPTYANNVDVGKATASATFAGDDNHTGSSGSATFDIGKAASTVTVSCPTTPQTYTGSAIEACAASYSGAGGLTGTLTPTYANNVDVGKATASATFAGDDNHTGSSGSATFDIGKAASTVTVSCPTTPQTYTGSAIEACTASYSGAGGLTGTLTPTYANNVDVGKATASATFAGDDNHTGSSGSATFDIAPATATVTLSDMTQVYDGTAKSVTVTTTPPGLSVSVTYNGSATLPINPGNYAVVATITAPNYTGAASGTFVILAKHSLTLVQGWNLVSFNAHPTNTAIAVVLSSIDGHYNLVYAWDATGGHSTSGNWMKFDPTAPGYQNSLYNLDETMGFWIYMTEADILDVVGSVPTTTNIVLSVNAGGWNLVGYPSSANRDLPAALRDHGVGIDFSLVYAYHAYDTGDPWKLYDIGATYSNDLKQLTSGWGYWIKANADNTWSVKYLAD